jgi:hypothetical protein
MTTLTAFPYHALSSMHAATSFFELLTSVLIGYALIPPAREPSQEFFFLRRNAATIIMYSAVPQWM